MSHRIYFRINNSMMEVEEDKGLMVGARKRIEAAITLSPSDLNKTVQGVQMAAVQVSRVQQLSKSIAVELCHVKLRNTYGGIFCMRNMTQENIGLYRLCVDTL